MVRWLTGRLLKRLPYRWRRVADTVVLVLLIGIVVWAAREFRAEQVYSSIRVVDGDSLRDGGEDIRLHGIDAPEYPQTCRDGTGRSYPCGKTAARHLRKLIGNAQVTCRVIDVDRYDRTVGVCRAGGRELNRDMVEAGWALAYTRHSFAYVSAERAARTARRGIWQGRFDRPEDWRDAQR